MNDQPGVTQKVKLWISDLEGGQLFRYTVTLNILVEFVGSLVFFYWYLLEGWKFLDSEFTWIKKRLVLILSGFRDTFVSSPSTNVVWSVVPFHSVKVGFEGGRKLKWEYDTKVWEKKDIGYRKNIIQMVFVSIIMSEKTGLVTSFLNVSVQFWGKPEKGREYSTSKYNSNIIWFWYSKMCTYLWSV